MIDLKTQPVTDVDALIFGEVLFDCFEDGSRVLGGAPFNVAWNLQALGAKPLMISRVGDDEGGGQVRDRMLDWGMSTAGLQSDSAHATGSVAVTIINGEPEYEIVSPRAWDFIDANNMPVSDAAMIYHGSLALRGATSAAALQKLVSQTSAPVFVDVNLRPPWWELKILHGALAKARYAKLNQGEVFELSDVDGDLHERADWLSRHYQLDLLIVTRGSEGAFALNQHGERVEVRPSEGISVVDTVGAGDAFTSVVLLGLLRNWSIDHTLARAQEFASALVGVRGATVEDPNFYRSFRERWSG